MEKMIPIIMDRDFNRLGLIDQYISFIWTARYYTCGDFVLTVDVNEQIKEWFKKDYYIVRDDDDHVGVIEKVEIEVREDSQEIVTVSGRFLSSLLGRRIIADQTQLNTIVSHGIYTLIQNNAIMPLLSARQIPGLKIGNATFTERLQVQYTGQNLLETIEEICETYGLGFKTTLSKKNEMIFQLYKGEDRSYAQTSNPYVVFSDHAGNLISSKYSEDYTATISDVLVAGEGEGIERKKLWVAKEGNSGLDRYEYFHDRRDLSTNNGEISEEDYQKQLKETGLEAITEVTTVFEGTVDFRSVEYKKDVFLGDICVTEYTGWGIGINGRLVEVIESMSETGEYSINPTFGL